MTATASEDDSLIKSYRDQEKLMKSARQVIKRDKYLLKGYEPIIKKTFLEDHI